MTGHNNDTWERLADLFDRMLASAVPAEVLSAEPDEELRRQAGELWQHHIDATSEAFLSEGIDFSVRPVFDPGQVLSNRFRIVELLGCGGMGEVYRAIDQRMEERVDRVECVALKTIARLLASSASLRSRIAAEVQNARRVTHRHVCRIHELFDDGEILFFTMEYIDGQLLSGMLESPVDRELARKIVRQLAEGLHAAHVNGVVHGDFKPANVMVAGGVSPRAVIMDFGLARAFGEGGGERRLSVQAGTLEYMSPELQDGRAVPDVRSDIYAFGKVAEALMPGCGLWDECVCRNPDERPASLEVILRRLDPPPARRYLLAGGALAATGALSYVLGVRQNPSIPEGARLIVNGFRTAADQLAVARVARGLLLLALRQSPRLRAISDQDFLPAVRTAGAALPLDNSMLRTLAERLRATFWVDAELSSGSGRSALRMRLVRASDQQAVAEKSFHEQQAGAVARVAAQWLRTTAGESERSLATNPAMATSYTSQVPEALQKYFEAMEHVSFGNMKDAIPLLEEAVRLDPQFAQARSTLGLAINPLLRHEEAYEHLTVARRLAERLPERERARIENDYAKLVDDPDGIVDAARRNRDYYPDDPRSYRALGWALARSGAPSEAVEYSRKAVEMSPNQDLYRMELIKHQVEAGQSIAAVAEYEGAVRNGIKNSWIHSAGGLALLSLGRYQEARDAYALEPLEPSPVFRVTDLQRASTMMGDLEAALSNLEQLRGGAASNPGERRVAIESLIPLYIVTDRRELASVRVRELADLPAYPQYLRTLQVAAFWAARVAEPAVLAAVRRRIHEIAGRWAHRRTRAVELHGEALAARQEGSLTKARDMMLEAQGLAYSVWTLFDLADIYGSLAQPSVALVRWREFHAARGVILSEGSPAVLVWSWLNGALAANAAGDRSAARELSRFVLDHWSGNNPRLPIVQMAAKLSRA